MNKEIESMELEASKEISNDKKDDNNSSLDESINKYDSDEESYQKPEEEEEYKEEQELEEESNQDNEFQKNRSEILNIGSVISKIKDFDNNVFKFEHLIYQDNYIIEEIKSFNIEKNYKINSLQQLFLKIIQQFSFDDINQCLFYNEVFIYLLKKTFYMLKNNGPNDELINIFNIIQRFSAQLLGKNILFLNQKESNKKKINHNDINSLCNISLQQIDYVMELFYIFISIHYLPLPDEFIDASLEYLIKLYNFINEPKDNFFSLNENDIIYIKKYLETIRQSIKNRKKFQISFSLEQYKNIFSFGFLLLRDERQLNIYFYIIEMLCDIIELVDDNHYINKFIVEFLLCFNNFLQKIDLTEEKFKHFKYSNKIYSLYLNFFGQYKLTNSEDISLFTYFFMKITCFLYLKNTIYFLKFMEEFMQKIFGNNNQSFLLFIIFTFKDFTKMKYDIEFSISINVITHIYLSISSLLSQSDIDLTSKKFCLLILKYFMDDLLKDLITLRSSYLCFGKENNKLKETLKIVSAIDKIKCLKYDKKNKKNKNQNNNKKNNDYDIYINKNIDLEMSGKKSHNDECNCFSCIFSTVNKKKAFKCGKCDVNTNLRLQLIDPNKDDDLTICGFCNIHDYFKSFSNIFENEDKLELVKTNDNVFAQYSKYSKEFKDKNKKNEKGKKNNNNDIDNQDKKMDDIIQKTQEEYAYIDNSQENELFDKCIFYQEIMYKKIFLFLKINLLNFIYISNQIQTQDKNDNINNSFKVFLRSLLKEEKLKDKNYITFIENLEQFFNIQKERVFNLHQDINIDEKTIQYFYFFHFYINFLFNGHWKILEVLISEKSQNWKIKYQYMKILEKFINIDKEANIFQNLSVKIIGPLLCDPSLNIREYSFELLFKLYQKKKIQRADLIYILYNNINESSFIIRKRAIIALSNLVFYEKERDSLKSIILIFLNKIYDNSESEKIKSIIYEFFIQIVKINKTNGNELLYFFLNIILELFSSSEEISENYNNYLSSQLNLLFEKIHDKIKTYEIMIDYLMQKYIININKDSTISKVNKNNKIKELSINERMIFIHSLNLIQILTKYHKKSISVYIEYFCCYLEYNSEISLHNNRIIQLSCLIINNYFDNKITLDNTSDKEKNKKINNDIEETFSIKYKTLCKIENLLLNIIINRAPIITFSALETYFNMIQNGIIDINKIEKFALINFTFLKKLKDDTNKLFVTKENIISKSITIFSYMIYSFNDEEIKYIFKDLYTNLDHIKQIIFDLLSFYFLLKYTKKKNRNELEIRNFLNSLSTKTFQSFTFFWVRFPDYLLKSDKIIQKTFDDLENGEEKIIILQSFIRLFKEMSEKCEESRQKKDSNFDYGSVHLFFETFIDKINILLIKESYDIVRLEAIRLIKLIIDLGNLNVHKIIPYAFASLFDCINEIRCIAVDIIQKGFSISKEKTLNAFVEGLKQAFIFQKQKYGNSNLINSFVKIIIPETKEYKNSNENIFELLFYKINKTNNKAQKKILEKCILVLKDISNIEGVFNSSNSINKDLKKCLNAIEYYEFVAKLIGDFKFQNPDEVYSIYDQLYFEYENTLCVFKTKYKQYKEDNDSKKMDLKLVYNYLKTGIYLFLFRYLFLKYHIFSESQLRDIYSEGWKKFLQKNVNLDTKKIKLPKKFELKMPKFKFIEFYSNFEILNIQLFDAQTKPNNKFNKETKANLYNCLGKLKSFANIDIVHFINLFNGRKKSYIDLSFKILFGDNNRGADNNKKRKSTLSNKEALNRISISKEDFNKGLEEEKSENESDGTASKKKKRNVKKEIKINRSDMKIIKRKIKYRKSTIVIEDEKEEIDI